MENSSDWDVATKKVRENSQAVAALKKELEATGKQASKTTMAVMGSKTRPSDDKTRGKTKTKDTSIHEDAKSYKDLAHNIEIWQEALENADPANEEQIKGLVKNISAAKKAQKAIKDYQESLVEKSDLSTLEGIASELKHQGELRQKATKENIEGIDAEIKRLNGLKTALEESGHVNLERNQIKTYEELEAEISYYEREIRHSTGTTREESQKQVNSLKKLREEWDETLEAMNAPEDIGKLSTIENLDEAISYYSTQQRRASGEEIANIQATINALESKKQALADLSAIPKGGDELKSLSSLAPKELKIELELIGIEGIKQKVRELDKLLKNCNLGDSQREELTRQISQWKNYEAQVKKSSLRLSDAWGQMKGIGNSINGISDALEGNGTAWEQTVGIVDSAIGLYESISGIISITQVSDLG